MTVWKVIWGQIILEYLYLDSHEIIKQIQEQIIKGIHKWNNTVGFYPVIGIYSINTDTDSPEIMYDRATLALSNAFEGQPDHICHYTQEMESRLEKEVELLSEIQEALKNNEFTFFAQPQCNIATHQIVGAEALVRWVKPDGTMVSSGGHHSGIGKERNDRPVGPLCMGQGMCVDKKLDRQGIPAGSRFLLMYQG